MKFSRKSGVFFIKQTLRTWLLALATICATAVGMADNRVFADSVTLSKEECVAIALEKSPAVKVANLEVKRMDYSKKEVLANLFPQIDFTGTYQRSIELQTMSMDFGGQSQSIKMGRDNTWNFGFSAAMPLANASLWKSISLSDTQILQSLEDARASRIDLVNNINKAYYSLLLAIDSKKVIQANYDLAKFNHELYQKQFEQGTASEYDVLRSSVQVKNVEPELLQADISVRSCQLQLCVLMGIETTVAIKPNITLSELKRDMYGYTQGMNRSLKGNSSLRSMDLQKKLADRNVTLQKLAWVPTLSASFNLNWNAISNGNALKNQMFNPYSNVGVVLQVPIFSGGSKYSKLRQAQVQAKEIEIQRENLVNSLNMQVDLAIDNINMEAKQIASSEEGVKQAAKALEIMQRSFEIGAATYLSLRDSELANTSAQLAYLQSIYNYLVSTSELDALLGKEETLGIK
ncbi:MAG: TolC family protein [Candidatus Amulumruptor caecigallinarius]|nr:TolC family protein [Candidatus Amulumruptor caecigallinarius]